MANLNDTQELLDWKKTALLVIDMQVAEYYKGCAMANLNDTQELLDWKKTALLVIDMQNDFILPGGPMWVAGGAAIVPAVKEAVAVAREKGALVVWVVREHDAYGRDVELFRRHFYREGKEKPTTKGTKGSELVEGLIIQEQDYKLVKTRFSAFFATNLHYLLQGAGISSVVIVGVQTPNCIRQTVFDAVALDYSPVIVLADATAAATPEVHAANLFDMRNVGVETPTLAAWIGSSSAFQERRGCRSFMACLVGFNHNPSQCFIHSDIALKFSNAHRSGGSYGGWVMADLCAISFTSSSPSKGIVTGPMQHIGIFAKQTVCSQTMCELTVCLQPCPLRLQCSMDVPRNSKSCSRRLTYSGNRNGFLKQGLVCAWV